MKKIKQSALCAVLAIVLVLTLCPSALAAGRTSEPLRRGHAVFSDISRIAAGESKQQTVRMADGTDAVIGLKNISQYARAGERTWQVWYKAVGVNVEFYMNVSNNRVTSVYDYSISLLGASYEDAQLTKTSTYGKLTFTAKTIGGLATSTCWLKGTVTGENDEIDVTWQM